jgi:hypothetical protein
MPKFTDLEKATCAEREVSQRLRVYPRLVEQHKMKQDFADRQIEMMQEIASEYRKSAEAQAPRLIY